MDFNTALSVVGPVAGVVAAIVAGTFATRVKVTEHNLAAQRDEFLAELSEKRAHDSYKRDVVRLAEEPLMYAASDLQSRIFKIVSGEIAAVSNESASRHQANSIEYTAFLFAQYFGWAEAIRQGVMVRAATTESGSKNERTISECIRKINDALRQDSTCDDFMLFTGEQHAIGELMLSWELVSGIRMPTVCRYAAFATRYRHDTEFAQWFAPIENGMKVAMKPAVTERLSEVQNYLIDIMELLDSENRIYKPRSRLHSANYEVVHSVA